jgi:tRNA pseudouridine55 synthase
MDGFLLCDKPVGATSHDVVAAVRIALRRRSPDTPRRELPRVGHAGTLDPFATGLLVVLIGRATRVQRYVMALPKTYEATARFGATSSTGDPEGAIVETGIVPSGDLALPTGEIRQRPPAFSAVKVDGQRSYALARAGKPVELAERSVTVRRFEELWRDGPRRGFAIECSSGTYVRSLVMALGDAYCEQLRRTAIGPFHVSDAGGAGELERMIALGDGLGAFMPRLVLEGDQARIAAHGRAVEGSATGPLLLVDVDGPIAIAEHQAPGKIKPVVGFRA